MSLLPKGTRTCQARTVTSTITWAWSTEYPTPVSIEAGDRLRATRCGVRRVATYDTVIGQPRASTGHSVTVASDFDGPAADGMSYRNQFSGNCPHHILTGTGHNVPQEAPNDFTSAVIDADSRS